MAKKEQGIKGRKFFCVVVSHAEGIGPAGPHAPPLYDAGIDPQLL